MLQNDLLRGVEGAIQQLSSGYAARRYRPAWDAFQKFARATYEVRSVSDVPLLQVADWWYDELRQVDEWEPGTKSKYYHAILEAIALAAELSLVPASHATRERTLPKFPRPSSRPELERWRDYEAFARWFDVGGSRLGCLSSNSFRLYQHVLQKQNPNTAAERYARLRNFWILRVQRFVAPDITAPPHSERAVLRYGLPWEGWPEPFKEAFRRYENKVDASNLRSLDTHHRQLAPDTVAQYRSKIGRLLGFVSLFEDELLRTRSLVELLSDTHLIERFMIWHRQNCTQGQPRTAHQDLLRLCATVLSAIAPLKDAEATLRGMARQILPVAAKPFHQRQIPDFVQVAMAVERCLHDVDRLYAEWLKNGSPDAEGPAIATAYAEALLFALLTWRPMRSQNCRELSLGRHLRRCDGRTLIVLQGCDTKTGTPLQLWWPQLLQERLDIYLKEFRPYLNLKGESTLFLNCDGTAYTRYGIWAAVYTLGSRYLSIATHPHAFRSWVTTAYLLAHDSDIETCRILLGHNRVDITLKAYVHVYTRLAGRKAAKFVRERCPSATLAAQWRPKVVSF